MAMESESSEELLNEYILSSQLLTDGEPVRCVTSTTSSNNLIELLAGSQGGIVSHISLPTSNNTNVEPKLEIQPGDSKTRHPFGVVAILSTASLSQTASNASLGSLYVTGCKDGIIRIIDGNTHQLKIEMNGHTNAVTSLSWIEGQDNTTNPWLVSGSWDGTAKIWNINSTNNTYDCLCTLDNHENTVSVAGLPCESNTVRKLVTVSAGVANGNNITGHTVRIWKLVSNASDVKSELVTKVSNDHSGPIRDVVYDSETHSIYTCSNDGTVKIRSAIDGKCTSTLAYPGNNDTPMFLSLCVVGNWKNKAVIAGSEDGNVVIWDVTDGTNKDAQIIGHPGTVWKVEPLASNSSSCDFITACNDGNIRIFTRSPSKVASTSVIEAFDKAVQESKATRSSGPTPEEIAKLPQWEMNSLTQGRSEGQVQVFQRDGKAIAAQWSASSQTWIEVGEVTGQNANAGTLNGQTYDHVLPIEIDVPSGGVQTLQIGYNNGDNPFVTAQNFIDEHMLNQGYLAQIADYIRQRAGESAPTLGGTAGGAASSGAPSAYSSAPTPMEVTPTYDYLPMKGYKSFDAGVDKKGLTKVIMKIREFNNEVTPSSKQLSSNEVNDILDTLSNTLSITNRYHSSTISDMELAIIHKMVTQWGTKHAFPALDLARMAVLHPDAASAKRRGYWEEVLGGALDMCLGMGESVVGEVAVPMLTMRLIANSYKGGSGSASAAGSLMDRYVTHALQSCIDLSSSSFSRHTSHI